MGKYLIKSGQRLMEAKGKAQLERLVHTGLVAKDALVRELPDGVWLRAEKHDATAALFDVSDGERTMIAVAPDDLRPRDDRPSGDEPAVYWVRTDASTVEARGVDVVARLLQLGVIRAEHGVASSPEGPFVALAEHPDFGAVDTARRKGLERRRTDGHGDRSVVIALATEDIEYLQEESGRRRAPGRREDSNIIVLSDADLEVVDDDLVSGDMVVAVDQDESVDIGSGEIEALSADDVEILESVDIAIVATESESDDPPVARAPRRDDSDVIQLDPDDIEEFEHLSVAAGQTDSVDTRETSWDTFCRAMNLAARRIATRGHSNELTWDLFRSMMERPGATAYGPTDSSWRRFQARISGRAAGTGRTPIPAETTWDRFREIMTAPGQDGTNNTWGRFVSSIQASRRGRNSLRSPDGGVIAGEAQIKSDVIRIVDAGPSVRLDGVGEE